MALCLHTISRGWQFDSSELLRESLATAAGLVNYIGSIEEAREYLNLLLELSQTFIATNETKDADMIIILDRPRRPFITTNETKDADAILRKVLKLLSIAGISLSDHDKGMVRQYSASRAIPAVPDFDSPYLKAADRLLDATYLVDILVDLWQKILLQRDYTTKAIKYERLLKVTPRWRLVKRFLIATKYQDCLQEIEYWQAHLHGHGFDPMYNPRYINTVNRLYGDGIEYGWPLIFYKSPLQAEQTFFDNPEEEAAVRAEWERSSLHHFGDEHLWRLMVLHCGLNCSVTFCRPTNNREERGELIRSAKELHLIYPEFGDLFRFSDENYSDLLMMEG